MPCIKEDIHVDQVWLRQCGSSAFVQPHGFRKCKVFIFNSKWFTWGEKCFLKVGVWFSISQMEYGLVSSKLVSA